MTERADGASIEEARRGIDALDREVVALIGRRFRYGAQESDVLEERRRWAAQEVLRPEVIEDLFSRLVSYFVNREKEDWKGDG